MNDINEIIGVNIKSIGTDTTDDIKQCMLDYNLPYHIALEKLVHAYYLLVNSDSYEFLYDPEMHKEFEEAKKIISMP